MLKGIFLKIAKSVLSMTDNQRAPMAKAAKTNEDTKKSKLNSNLVPLDDIGNDGLQSSPNIKIHHRGLSLIEEDKPLAQNMRET